MKVVNLHAELNKLIKKAQSQDRVAQYLLYKQFSGKMLGAIRNYISDNQYAEDVLQKAFCKALLNLKSFGFKGSFEGWLRRIVVRESIDFLRQSKSLMIPTDDFDHHTTDENPMESVQNIAYIEKCLETLPDGYKTVFCLYVLEDFKHKEIASLLNIDVGTSKSQLFKARRMLKEKLKHHQKKSSL